MKAFVPDYNIESPDSLSQLLHELSADPKKWKLFAGGTDLMVLFESGKLQHKNFLDISRINELKGIKESASELSIGAAVTYSELQKDPIIKIEFPIIAQAGKLTGAKAIQNRGTIGGNIANASPAADTPPALLAYGAKLEITSKKGTRQIAYAGFHKDYKKMDLASDEIIAAVILPRGQNWTHHYYKKIGTRAYQSISKVAVSAVAKIESNRIIAVKIGLASVAAYPSLATSLEQYLIGKNISEVEANQVKTLLAKAYNPIDDIRSTASYRKRILENVVLDFLEFKNKLHLEA